MIVIVLLVSVTIASWLFVINGGGMGMPALKMTSLDLAYGGGMRMPFEMASWTAGYAIVMYFMCWVMMIAMMLPSASTAILLSCVPTTIVLKLKGSWKMPIYYTR